MNTEMQKIINDSVVITALIHMMVLFYYVWAAKEKRMGSVNKCALQIFSFA